MEHVSFADQVIIVAVADHLAKKKCRLITGGEKGIFYKFVLFATSEVYKGIILRNIWQTRISSDEEI